jgi:2-hydroxychromene-2-carboxylate isomerase
MPAPLEFFFDFSSPYAYLASHRVGPIAERHGRDVRWRPMMLGPAMAATGGKPLVQVPLKGDYARRDLPRTARFHDIPFQMPSRFPQVTLAAARLFYWLQEQTTDRAVPFAQAVFEALFVDDQNTADRAVLGRLAIALDIDAAAALDAIDQPDVKERLKAATTEAVERGVFGSPFIFVDGEPFWGADRLDQVDRWLATGGF